MVNQNGADREHRPPILARTQEEIIASLGYLSGPWHLNHEKVCGVNKQKMENFPALSLWVLAFLK